MGKIAPRRHDDADGDSRPAGARSTSGSASRSPTCATGRSFPPARVTVLADTLSATDPRHAGGRRRPDRHHDRDARWHDDQDVDADRPRAPGHQRGRLRPARHRHHRVRRALQPEPDRRRPIGPRARVRAQDAAAPAPTTCACRSRARCRRWASSSSPIDLLATVPPSAMKVTASIQNGSAHQPRRARSRSSTPSRTRWSTRSRSTGAAGLVSDRSWASPPSRSSPRAPRWKRSSTPHAAPRRRISVLAGAHPQRPGHRQPDGRLEVHRARRARAPPTPHALARRRLRFPSRSSPRRRRIFPSRARPTCRNS